MKTTSLGNIESELVESIVTRELNRLFTGWTFLEAGWDYEIESYYGRVKIDGEFKDIYLNGRDVDKVRKELKAHYTH